VTEPQATDPHPILFFDGVCNLCNSWVDWVIKRDRRRVFRFASLQGQTAYRLVPQYSEEAGLSTVCLVVGDKTYIRSTAVLQVLKRLGGIYAVLGALGYLIPRPWRDAWYRRIAEHRYEKYGKRDTCRLPTQEERERFLP
jgi:predicted DCC family thiol-disulfide oxidoreductase YuxK